MNRYARNKSGYPYLGRINVPANSEDPPHVRPPLLGMPCHQSIPDCRTDIPWVGPREYLFKNDEIEGMIVNIKGISSRGRVVVRQDPLTRDRVNVTSKIFLSEDSLQQQISFKVVVRDSDVTISIDTPSFDGPIPTKRCVHADVFITFPSNLNYFRSLSVDVSNSMIEVEHVNKINFAYVNVKTANGDINGQRLRAETAEIATVNGNIRGSYVVADTLVVKNVNGMIDIVPHLHPWSERVSVDVHSIKGLIQTEVRDLFKNQTIEFLARSINGHIVTNMPNEFEGSFSAKTVIGYAQVVGEDLHFDVNKSKVKVGYKAHANDDKNKSASRANLEAVAGSVELFFKKQYTPKIMLD